jgi:hypothetical protein
VIGLVSCSNQKLSRAAAAREIYTSQLFVKSLAYAEAWCKPVYVLSALHGLVGLEQQLEPYNKQLRPGGEAYAWAHDVAADLAMRHGPRAELLILAGETYSSALIDELVIAHGFATQRIHTPLVHLQIGQRLSLLTHGCAAPPHELGRFLDRNAQEVTIE